MRRNCSQGFSLLELLTSLFISAVMIMALVGVYRDLERSQVQQQQLADMAQVGRFVVAYLNPQLQAPGTNVDVLTPDQFYQRWRIRSQLGSDVLLIEHKGKVTAYYIKQSSRGLSFYQKQQGRRAVALTDGVLQFVVQRGLVAANHRDITRYIAAGVSAAKDNVGAVQYQLRLRLGHHVSKIWQSYVMVTP